MQFVNASSMSSFAFDAPSDISRRIIGNDAALRRVAPFAQSLVSLLCNPDDLTADECAIVDSLVSEVRAVARGVNLYHADDPLHHVYLLRTGSFKSVIVNRDGREQVTGFPVAGDMLGLDSIGRGQHLTAAVALERSNVCVIPFDMLESACSQIKPVQQHLHRIMSREIARKSNLLMQIGTMRAEQRVAAFLLHLAARYARRGYASNEFTMRMTRAEIGSYLGITLETTSRMFSRLQRENIVLTRGKQVRILDSEALARL
jgi:CRP/FNR family transcriptional regulator, anaerobic regulatory protein